MDNALVIDLARENIGSLLSGGDAQLRLVGIEQALRHELNRGDVRFGYWGDFRKDPLPDFLLIRDDELADTTAWLSAFLTGLAPISQWCRVLPLTTAERIATRAGRAREEFLLSAWTGAILSEASGLAEHRSSSLKDAPGLLAISSACYAASRAVYIWGHGAPLGELATRFDELARRLGHSSRGSDSKRLLPLWSLLAGSDVGTKVGSDREVLHPFRQVLSQVESDRASTHPFRDFAKIVGEYFGVSEVELCAVGPQSSRVGALDSVARKMLSGPRSIAIDAVLGFSASLIDPGVAVLPELLRRYSQQAPLAPIWTGAFAGIWSPMRIMSDNGGLGRIVAKDIVKSSDLFTKPTADISFEELVKWIGLSGEGRPRIRAMSASSLNVEIIEGVSVPFSYIADVSRSDGRVNSAPSTGQRSLELRQTDGAATKLDNDSVSRSSNKGQFEELEKRIDVLERLVASFASKSTRTTSRSSKK